MQIKLEMLLDLVEKYKMLEWYIILQVENLKDLLLLILKQINP